MYKLYATDGNEDIEVVIDHFEYDMPNPYYCRRADGQPWYAGPTKNGIAYLDVSPIPQEYLEVRFEGVIYEDEVFMICPFCGSTALAENWSGFVGPDAKYTGKSCTNCGTGFPVRPDPGPMDVDYDIPF